MNFQSKRLHLMWLQAPGTLNTEESKESLSSCCICIHVPPIGVCEGDMDHDITILTVSHARVHSNSSFTRVQQQQKDALGWEIHTQPVVNL